MNITFMKTNNQEQTPCTGVSMGHYAMTSLPSGHLGTDSLGSCFAFIYVSRYQYAKYVVMVHVSDNKDAKWIVDLNLNQGDPAVAFALVTGVQPQGTTLARMKSLIDKYHIPEENVLNNSNTQRGGVLLSNVADDASPVVITSCRSISATNEVLYKQKNQVAMVKTGPPPPMTDADRNFYRNEFHSGE